MHEVETAVREEEIPTQVIDTSRHPERLVADALDRVEESLRSEGFAVDATQVRRSMWGVTVLAFGHRAVAQPVVASWPLAVGVLVGLVLVAVTLTAVLS